jgi:hypothetical protein
VEGEHEEIVEAIEIEQLQVHGHDREQDVVASIMRLEDID